jgi:hypothetical protein
MLALIKLIQSLIKTLLTSWPRFDQVERQLQAELKRLTAGLVPGLELPKIKL